MLSVKRAPPGRILPLSFLRVVSRTCRCPSPLLTTPGMGVTKRRKCLVVVTATTTMSSGDGAIAIAIAHVVWRRRRRQWQHWGVIAIAQRRRWRRWRRRRRRWWLRALWFSHNRCRMLDRNICAGAESASTRLHAERQRASNARGWWLRALRANDSTARYRPFCTKCQSLSSLCPGCARCQADQRAFCGSSYHASSGSLPSFS